MGEQQSLQYAREADTSPPPCRLLAIDDDTSICEVIEKLGEKAGFATA